MVLLKFQHTEFTSSHHLFDSLKDALLWMRDCYTEVIVSETGSYIYFTFEEIRSHAEVINPIAH